MESLGAFFLNFVPPAFGNGGLRFFYLGTTMKSNATRRQFIKKSSSLMAAPYFAPAAALGLGKSVAPSDRIVMGAIGCGGKGKHNTQQFLNDERVQVIAACDVDSAH